MTPPRRSCAGVAASLPNTRQAAFDPDNADHCEPDSATEDLHRCMPHPETEPPMNDPMLNCPNCGHSIALSEALTARIRGAVEAEVAAGQQQRLAQAVDQARREATEALAHELALMRQAAQANEQLAREAAERELQLKRRTVELEQAQREAEQRLRLEIEAQWRADADKRARALADAAAKQARGAAALELEQAQAQLAAQRKQIDQAHAAELALRRQAEELRLREHSLDLELARRVDARRGEWEAQWRTLNDQEQTLKLREKERLIDELRSVIDELRRKSRQGSQQQQGETLELDIEAALAARFPRDRLHAVPKGMNGADLIHEVRDAALADCGRIVWEIKSTRHWQPAWLAKLRDDQRACGAAVAVLVSVALPEAAAAPGFALIDGVWVCSLSAWPALATVLREQLLQVAFARSAATGMDERMQALHRYLAGDAFRHRVEAIVEAFTALQAQLARERRAMEKLWKERERQLDRIVGSTAGMYGELRGTVGGAMAAIAALELDADAQALDFAGSAQ